MTRFDGLLQNAKQKKDSKLNSTRKQTKPQSDIQTSEHLDVHNAQTSGHLDTSNIQTSKHSSVPDIQTSGHLDSNPSSKTERSPKGKSSDSQYLRTTLYLSKALHKRLKMGALEHDMEMSDIAEAAISEWLDNHS